MKSLSNIVSKLQDQLFNSVVSSNLIYNTCWEDPRIDRSLLQLDNDSQVVMLTSAGCNALDYLLDNPHKVHCVDINPAQNALLELKKALFEAGKHHLLWDFFGKGAKKGAKMVYRQKLRSLLPSFAQTYWDGHIDYFEPTSVLPSFYFRGTSGNVARLIHNRIQRKGLYPQVLNMLDAEKLSEQAYYFQEIEPQIWNTFSKWLVRQPATMTMIGVPATQRKMIEKRYTGGILDFIRESLNRVFTKQTLQDNYFWRVYLTGSYRSNCCPNYLLEENFETLKKRTDNINTHTSTLSNFLEQNPDNYSHFVLLDHQDWMADAQPDALAKEWQLILSNAQQGAKILFRSAGSTLSFLPEFVFDYVDFNSGRTDEIHQQDRVGTYESTHLGIVQ
ncbi:S-adenosylmethionine-diacylglycerol 3-amino-3-carboxypropyl transferase [Fodinibius salinus]|uniref:S-adenosylmethionine-diacylglycerol 3-amino-3-carboxypropyl transferase n=1 Tax=Fodinibius salinus TaxID=860790 RepID=A0A5D3YR32_9BACT|nr:BtaA family protein [Fodinibius salinus]TYP95463.1 S-adenosylmethionine-diacylglycerol 3-amino-3-carboxypropyl transferase [Fodinibius salinus]